MKVIKCDSCEEILTGEDYHEAGNFRVKKAVSSWGDFSWDRVDLCRACFRSLQLIAEKLCR